MPDYNRKATIFWWMAVVVGAFVLVGCLAELARAQPMVWLQVLLGSVLAMAAGLFPIRIPRSKNSYVAGEIFIFLLLLLLGPAAAVLAAAAEALMATLRSSKRWTSRLVSPATASIAMIVAGTTLGHGLAALDAAGWGGTVALIGATMAAALLYFLLNVLMISGVQRLKRNERFSQLGDLLSVFRWVGMAYAGSAAVAALLYVTYQQSGIGVLMVMLPLLAMLLVTLHLYFQQQEANELMRQVNADAALRDAATAEREALVAQKHLLELQASEHRFYSAFTHASIGMALMEFDGNILQANAALHTLLGQQGSELVGQRFQALVHAEELAKLKAKLGLVNEREFEGFATELRCLHADGSSVWVALHCGFFTEPGAATPCLILQAQDISARRSAEAGMQRLAYHDSLTGLPNRRRFNECLAAALARAKADATHPFAVMFLDFDRFKLVNDSLGHNAGDELLALVAQRVQEKLRPGDIFARLGGDEFAVLAEQIEHERDAIVLAERLMEALRRPFVVGGADIVASASIGITFSAFGYDKIEDVLRDADTAMYKAKNTGKARYALFDASLHAEVSRRLRLEGELRRAIDQGQLSVDYQPLFELAHGRLTGFEALVRWAHPADGPIGPLAFLPIAEETGMMPQLSDFVIHCACRQLREWQRSDPSYSELTMSINVSAEDLAHPAIVARITRAIIEAGLRPEHLTLELTENILMARIEGGLATLAELRRLGVRLAVDDFGTGYSSLSHLAKLPIDTLKIDRSFVGHLKAGSDEAAVVRAIVQLGASLRKSVVAEGIESAAQMEQLREMGCGYGQGFHLATPLPAQAAGELLRAQLAQAGQPGTPLH